MYYKRTLSEAVETANKFFKVVLICGPRQVGKTTLFRKMKDSSRKYVSLDDGDDLLLAQEDPQEFFVKYPPPVFIDEIQRAPGLFIHIKRIVDQSEQKGQFWLTGSQAFSLMANVSESLAGRVAILNLQGLSVAEKLKEWQRPIFDVEMPLDTERKVLSKQKIFENIVRGSFPQLLDGTPLSLYFSSYVSAYVERDIKDIVNITKERSFLRFLKIVAARTGQILNYNDISRDAEVSAPTVKSWVSLLETLGLVYLLQPYGRNLSQRAIKSPKLYFLDTGLCCFLCGINTAELALNMPINGALFETFVVSEILKSYWHHGEMPSVYFYRDSDNNKEIDLVLERHGKVYPMEIKMTATPTLHMVKNFSVIPEDVRGKGAIVCLSSKLTAMNKDIVVVPASYI